MTGCPICGREPEFRETFFGVNLICKRENHLVTAWGDTREQAEEEWEARFGWHECETCGNKTYIGTLCPVCGR